MKRIRILCFFVYPLNKNCVIDELIFFQFCLFKYKNTEFSFNILFSFVHRAAHTHKFRRHANEVGSRPYYKEARSTASELRIEILDEYADTNKDTNTDPTTGRLEIMCLSTIPSHVSKTGQFSDYKTSAHKGK